MQCYISLTHALPEGTACACVRNPPLSMLLPRSLFCVQDVVCLHNVCAAMHVKCALCVVCLQDIVCLHSLPSQPHLVVATSSDSAVVVWDTLHRHCLYTTRLTTHTPSPQSSLLYNSFPVDLHDVLHTRMHQQTLQQLRDGLQHADGPQTGVRGGAVLACEDGDKHDGGRWVVGANGLLDTRTPGPGQRHTETALRTRLLTGLATQAIGETPVVKVLVGGAPGTVCRTGPASGAGVGRGGVGVGATLLRPQGQRGSGSSDATGTHACTNHTCMPSCTFALGSSSGTACIVSWQADAEPCHVCMWPLCRS